MRRQHLWLLTLLVGMQTASAQGLRQSADGTQLLFESGNFDAHAGSTTYSFCPVVRPTDCEHVPVMDYGDEGDPVSQQDRAAVEARIRAAGFSTIATTLVHEQVSDDTPGAAIAVARARVTLQLDGHSVVAQAGRKVRLTVRSPKGAVVARTWRCDRGAAGMITQIALVERHVFAQVVCPSSTQWRHIPLSRKGS